MKSKFTLSAIAGLLTLMAIITFSCQDNSFRIKEADPDEETRIKEPGSKITLELVNSLKGELKAAISQGGLNEAIGVCNLKAIPVTEIVAKNYDKGNISIKRVTNKYRNPANAPDSAESLALKKFEDLAAGKQALPEYYIQKITDKGKTYFNYYKPMKIEPLCLACHGDIIAMDTTLAVKLKELYPGDKATGYQDGDFRGLIRITFPE